MWKTASIDPAVDCSDERFVRRLYLDVCGRVPTVDEQAALLNSGDADRRAKLVRSLLQSEDHVQHFANTFDALLLGRGSQRTYSQRRKHEWRPWLERVFRENRPWNDVVKEILLARPASQEDRGAVWFLYERNNDHQQIAEAVAPAFFGIRIECAQCHDHMMAMEIEQAHYWGLVAFFKRSRNRKTANGPRIAESAVGGFSEFANLAGNSTPNLLTFLGTDTVDEKRPDNNSQQEDADELYVPARLENDPRVPHFSRRERFVEDVVTDHPLIARAFVNRIWALLMGRGIVHPFDEMDSTHEPSHPDLLTELAENFRESGYNIRQLVRAIVLSRPYQLESRRPNGLEDPATFAWSLEKPLTAEQLAASMEVVLRNNSAAAHQDSELLRDIRDRMPDVLPKESVSTIRDALFLTNNTALNEFIAQSNDDKHLIPRCIQLNSNHERADLLFRIVFGRSATADERTVIINYLQDDGQRLEERLQQTVWSMLTSAEFRFNH